MREYTVILDKWMPYEGSRTIMRHVSAEGPDEAARRAVNEEVLDEGYLATAVFVFADRQQDLKPDGVFERSEDGELTRALEDFMEETAFERQQEEDL